MYENERWGNPNKNKRYQRIEDKKKYDKNWEEARFGKDVDPKRARKLRISYD